mgnify:CR=1 FL=1
MRRFFPTEPASGGEFTVCEFEFARIVFGGKRYHKLWHDAVREAELEHFRATHRYCGRCGAPAEPASENSCRRNSRMRPVESSKACCSAGCFTITLNSNSPERTGRASRCRTCFRKKRALHEMRRGSVSTTQPRDSSARDPRRGGTTGAHGARLAHGAGEYVLVGVLCHKSVPGLEVPRLNPATVVLVTRGEEALLVHARNFSRPMYALVAGFVQTAESPRGRRRATAQESSRCIFL